MTKAIRVPSRNRFSVQAIGGESSFGDEICRMKRHPRAEIFYRFRAVTRDRSAVFRIPEVHTNGAARSLGNAYGNLDVKVADSRKPCAEFRQIEKDHRGRHLRLLC
jgi:hypothetical protein